MMTPCSGGLGGPLTQSLLSPPCGIKGCPLWHVNVWQYAECYCQPGKFARVGGASFYKYEWLDRWPQGWMKFPAQPPPPQKSGWHQVAQNPNPLICGDRGQPEPFLLHRTLLQSKAFTRGSVWQSCADRGRSVRRRVVSVQITQWWSPKRNVSLISPQVLSGCLCGHQEPSSAQLVVCHP